MEIVLLSIAWLPHAMSLNAYAFCDWGSNLTLQYLVSHGYRPTVDFAYLYGLLAVLSGQIWFGVFGRTPDAYQAAVFVCDLLMVMALVRIVARLRLGPLGIMIMIIGLGYAVQATYPNLSQALEATLLCQALAAQALGNKPRALAFGSAAVLAEPSMGYFYSLLLLVLIALELRGRSSNRVRSWARALAPAAIIFGVLVAIVAFVFGLLPLIHSLFPITGMRTYRDLHCGFFTGVGSRFWDPAGRTWFYYFVTPSGFWILATLYLIAAGLRAFRRAFAGGFATMSASDEIIITCAVLHLTFVCLFFGNQWSWVYYSYLLVLGIAVSADISTFDRRIALPLCMLGVVSWTVGGAWLYQGWTTLRPSAVTAGLWASARERNEWKHVLASVHGHRAVTFDNRGAAGLLFPQLEPPVTLFLVHGLTTDSEVRRKVAQIAGASQLIIPLGNGPCYKIPTAPRLRSALKDFTPLWTGRYFEVLQRTSDGVGSGHTPARDSNFRASVPANRFDSWAPADECRPGGMTGS